MSQRGGRRRGGRRGQGRPPENGQPGAGQQPGGNGQDMPADARPPEQSRASGQGSVSGNDQGSSPRRRNRRPRRRGGERRPESGAAARRAETGTPERPGQGQARPDNARPAEREGIPARPGAAPAPDARFDEEEDASEEYVPKAAAPAPEMPLVTYLARAGVGSRRQCDELITSGRVSVGGEQITFPRERVPAGAEVTLDGEPVHVRELRYALVNKPRGVASTRSDPHAASVVVDMVPGGRTLFPVGRLDVDTTGLIVLTNDGRLAHRLMHPSYGVPKTYVVRVRGRVGKRALGALRAGVELEDGMTAPAEARVLKQSGKTALVELTIHQGRKRQVRRMFTTLGLPVDELHRRRYGPLQDRGLAVGEWRELSAEEVDALRRAAERVDSCVLDEPEEHAVPLSGEHEPAPEASLESTPEERQAASGAAVEPDLLDAGNSLEAPSGGSIAATNADEAHEEGRSPGPQPAEPQEEDGPHADAGERHDAGNDSEGGDAASD